MKQVTRWNLRGFSPKMKKLLAKVARQSQRHRTLNEQAAALGITREQLYAYRSQAKVAGFQVRPERVIHRGGMMSSPRLAAVDETMTFACRRCFLRGPSPNFAHVCIGPATDYMRSGRPAGGDSFHPS